MTVKPIDLSALDAFVDRDNAEGAGKPLMLDIASIHEDPNQPRKTFEDLLELAASIAEVGIKVPISVRPHPQIPGQYVVKFGARRRRAAISAGLKQIPAWIDDVPSDFEQVVENLQRKALTAMELAYFMAAKQAAGIKVGHIARKLGVSSSTVTKHLALVDLPPEIDAVYHAGRSTSPETIFELRTVYNRHPDETKAWLSRDVEISRRSVEELKRAIAAGTALNEETLLAVPAKRPKVCRTADPAEIRRPVVVLRVGERLGIVVLNRRANEDGHVLLKWDDTAEVEQVPNEAVHFVRLDDARRYQPIDKGLTGHDGSAASRPAKPYRHT